MRFRNYTKYLAMAVSASCFFGAGTFNVYGAAGTRQASESAAGAEAAKETGAEAAKEILDDKETEAGAQSAAEKTGIEWWICPTGAFSDEDSVQGLVDEFEEAFPQTDVSFRILDAEGGEKQVQEALGSDDAPDVVLGAPEYIVTEWGGSGLMEDLGSLWDERVQNDFRSEMRDASKNREGVFYAVPLYRDLFTMAINYDKFEEAGAIQYMNAEAHSWKDSGFIDSVLRVHDTLVQNGDEAGLVGKVYCKDQTGQRAFMCFVENFFKKGLVDDYHSAYKLSSGKIRGVFATLKNLQGKGIEYDAAMDGDDENKAFLNGDVLMTFNWSAAKQKEAQGRTDFRIFPMMYPNSKNVPTLTGTIGALGVVKKDDEARREAALEFVRFLMTDEKAYTDAVLTSGCFPARLRLDGRELKGLYGDDDVMELYEVLNDYYSDYEPVMELFTRLDERWPELLQKIAAGEKTKDLTVELDEEFNKELEEKYGIHEIQTDEEEE